MWAGAQMLLDVMLGHHNAAYLQTKADKMGHMIDMARVER